MTKHPACLLLVALIALSPLKSATAQEVFKPDDTVTIDLATEGWVTTKTARVILSIEAAVSGSNAGTMRNTMNKALDEVVKADWRLTSFNRGQDQTGMERWSALYEARLPENELNGLQEAAKKNSKAGMQLTVASVDFSPTLDETQATIAQLRTQLYKQATEQLATLNGAMPGRNYRISALDFSNATAAPMPVPMHAKMMRTMAAPAADMAEASGGAMERSEKITVGAHLVFAASSEHLTAKPATNP